ncbi:DUF3883 domain-containing protein [Undibacterium sp.]|uniref:DUF3883 domain-containing protein n=1 Tax=Undibacterium sp. TaxID=1914977 RepID=UPI0037504185
MIKSTSCIFDGKKIQISDALSLRAERKGTSKKSLTFLCTECGQIVDPHVDGENSPAHFEHRERNADCSLSVPMKSRKKGKMDMQEEGIISTDELARRTAGGIGYIRTKSGTVKGLALRLDLNPNAPDIVVVGKGVIIESSARLFLESGVSVPTFVKRAANAWKFIGDYRAMEYKTDKATIRANHADRRIEDIAGILFLERTDEPKVVVRGGGFADANTRAEIEKAAIEAVTDSYEANGFVIDDRQRENIGYDLEATKGRITLKLEVKGTDSEQPRFFLTRNEMNCSSKDTAWRLVVVTQARKSPEIRIYTHDEMKNSFHLDELAWECTPIKSDS